MHICYDDNYETNVSYLLNNYRMDHDLGQVINGKLLTAVGSAILLVDNR